MPSKKNVKPSKRNPRVMVGPDLNRTRSLGDCKQYRYITLPNGLECLVVSAEQVNAGKNQKKTPRDSVRFSTSVASLADKKLGREVSQRELAPVNANGTAGEEFRRAARTDSTLKNVQQQQQDGGAASSAPHHHHRPLSVSGRPLSINGKGRPLSVSSNASNSRPLSINGKTRKFGDMRDSPMARSSPALVCSGDHHHHQQPGVSMLEEIPEGMERPSLIRQPSFEVDTRFSSNRIAAVSMAVGVGSYSEPDSCQGLAHFLEHMNFMGSTKYPRENEFDSFLSNNGGSSNAYTDSERTVYYFSCFQKDLRKALDIFAQFFISPLLLKDACDREVNSIENEFALRQNVDDCRAYEIWRHNARVGTPYTKFCCGNEETLNTNPLKTGVNVYEELRKFHDRFYVAPNMRLVVVGYDNLDSLEDMVVELFEGVDSGKERQYCEIAPNITRFGAPWRTGNKDIAKRLAKEGIWDGILKPDLAMKKDDETTIRAGCDGVALGCLFRIIPVADVHRLNLIWQLPPQKDNYKALACDYIAHLIGHESKGSILAELKARGWASALEAGCQMMVGGFDDNTGSSLMSIQIQLTVQGLYDWTSVAGLVFEYIGMLRKSGYPKWIFDEAKSLNSMRYQYKEEEEYQDYAVDLSVKMLPQWELDKNWLLDTYSNVEWEPEIIDEVMNHLRPELVRVDIRSSIFWPQNQTDYVKETFAEILDFHSHDCAPMIEPYTKTQYFVNPLPTSTISLWNDLLNGVLYMCSNGTDQSNSMSKLHLPPPNPYIPRDFTVMALLSTKKFIKQGLLMDKRLNIQQRTIISQGSSTISASPENLLKSFFNKKKTLDEYIKRVNREKMTWMEGDVVQHLEDDGNLLVNYGNGLYRWYVLDEPEQVNLDDNFIFMEDGLKAMVIGNSKTASLKNSESLISTDSSNGERSAHNGGKRKKKRNRFFKRFLSSKRNGGNPRSAMMKQRLGRLSFLAHAIDPALEDGIKPEQREAIWESFPEISGDSFEQGLPALVPGSNDLLKVWYLSDTINLVPRTECYIRILSPLPSLLPLFTALLDLLGSLLFEALRDESYLAMLAELELNVDTNEEGLTLQISGFSEKLPTFVDKIFVKIRDLANLSRRFRRKSMKVASLEKDTTTSDDYLIGLNEKAFFAQLETLIREYSNEATSFHSDGPLSSALYKILVNGSWHPETLFEAADVIKNREQVADFCALLMTRCRVECFVSGNVEIDQARELYHILAEHLEGMHSRALPDDAIPKLNMLEVPPSRVNPNKDDPWHSVTGLVHPLEALEFEGHSVDLYFQLGPDNIENRLIAETIEQFMKEPIYSELRSRRQIGYMVQCRTNSVLGMLGFLVEITSNSHQPQEIASIVDQFFIDFRKSLAQMDPLEFHETVCALARSKIDTGVGIKQQAADLWEAIALQRYYQPQRYEWKNSLEEITFLNTSVSLQRVLKAFDKWLLPSSPHRRRVSVLVFGTSFEQDAIKELNKRRKYVSVVDTEFMYKRSNCTPDCVNLLSDSKSDKENCLLM